MADQENQVLSMRHYRSMLVVDAPSLGPHKPMSYDEFYVDAMPGIDLWTYLATRTWHT